MNLYKICQYCSYEALHKRWYLPCCSQTDNFICNLCVTKIISSRESILDCNFCGQKMEIKLMMNDIYSIDQFTLQRVLTTLAIILTTLAILVLLIICIITQIVINQTHFNTSEYMNYVFPLQFIDICLFVVVCYKYIDYGLYYKWYIIQYISSIILLKLFVFCMYYYLYHSTIFVIIYAGPNIIIMFIAILYVLLLVGFKNLYNWLMFRYEKYRYQPIISLNNEYDFTL